MRVGFAKRDITPKPGVFLAGNGEHQSVRIHDPLSVRAAVLKTGSEWLALVSCDLIGLDAASTLRVRKLLREKPELTPDHLFIVPTHTHNGPHTRFTKHAFLKHRDEVYLNRVEAAIAEAVEEASKQTQDAVMKAARGAALENFNRRLVTPDGTAHFYNPRTLRAHPEYEKLTTGVADAELNALQFTSPQGEVLLTLVQYAAHPLTVGIYEHVISADYCGVLVDRLEEATGAPALFLQGACGDLHCKGLFEGFERQREMGGNLAEETLRILKEPALEEDAPELRVTRTRLRLPIDSARRENGEWVAEYFQDPYEVEMSAAQVGPVVMASLPGEVCIEPGLQIKWNSPFLQTWLLYNCHAYSSYMVHPRAYLEGGYEANNNCLAPEAAPAAVTTALELCRKLKQSKGGFPG